MPLSELDAAFSATLRKVDFPAPINPQMLNTLPRRESIHSMVDISSLFSQSKM
jgi:hypothetical protein